MGQSDELKINQASGGSDQQVSENRQDPAGQAAAAAEQAALAVDQAAAALAQAVLTEEAVAPAPGHLEATPGDDDSTEIPADLIEVVEKPSLPPPKAGAVEVNISSDKLAAFLVVIPPERGGAPADMAQVTQAMDLAGVLFGVDEAAIAQALEAGATPRRGMSRPVRIATGEPPVPGEDGRVILGDALSEVGGVPVARDDGSVDFFNLNIVRNVTPRTVLGTKTLPTQGTAGTAVTGEPIPAQDGAEVRWKAGTGTALSEDGMQVLAAIEGHAQVDERDWLFTVRPIFEVRADVGPETGSIDFKGTVIVRGSIQGGFTVKATHDLEVHGGIDGGSAEIGGNITVRYGIQGAGRGKVVSGGHVTCRFIENANVDAKGDVTVTDGILHSFVNAGGKITAPGRKGLIVGGLVRAREQIVARVVGSSLATPTELEVGTDPAFKDKMQALVKGLREVEDAIKKTVQVVTLLKEMEAKRPAEFTPARRDTLIKALHSLRRVVEQQTELNEQKAALEAAAELSLTGTIKISDVIFPGVRITICNSMYLVDDTMRGGNFYFSAEEGLVKVG